MIKNRKLAKETFRLAVLVTVIIFVTIIANIALFSVMVAKFSDNTKIPSVDKFASEIYKSDSSYKNDGNYKISKEAKANLKKFNYWAMIIGEDGEVKWSIYKPSDIPKKYTITDVSSFSKWYLNDYPIKTWKTKYGLFVLGSTKNSFIKYNIEMQMSQFEFWVKWFIVTLICNFIIILAVTLFMTKRWQKKQDKARSEWISGLSHDIRTPLAIILGHASSMEEDEELSIDNRKQCAVIRQKSKLMSSLIEDLNTTNLIEYSNIPLEKEKVFLPGLIRKIAVKFINSDIEGKYPIEVDISKDASALEIYGNRKLLKRMFNNLISNSINHNPNGCTISIKLSSIKNKCKLVIDDNGVGFTEEKIKFLKGKSKKIPISGHGRGLFIVKSIVKEHDGNIEFTNNSNGGSSCIIILKKRGHRK